VILCLNWGKVVLPSAIAAGSFPTEKWFLINGITVGDYWLESGVDKLSSLFKRRIYGIHNKRYSHCDPF
jgi:hypothetical protein